jgi:hypothetical protein
MFTDWYIYIYIYKRESMFSGKNEYFW